MKPGLRAAWLKLARSGNTCGKIGGLVPPAIQIASSAMTTYALLLASSARFAPEGQV
jgi:hypothetical protein